jgi:hypothetical protein
MADPSKIKLYPINFNQIILVDANTIQLEIDAFVPSGWKPPPGVTPIGGSDVKAKLTDPQSTTG